MSATARHQVFSAVHTIGGLLPADMLVRISEGKDVKGCLPADYRVIGSRSVRDDAERHWDYLKSVWSELRQRLPVAPEAETPADPTGIAITQWLEPLFAELGFGRLTPIGASGMVADDGGKTFPISHRWNHVPIHLAAWNAGLDKRPGGAGTVPPQSLLQECLNRTEAHLWGVVSNGRQLRLLRDSSALATAAYVEFDLEAIFDGELFSEFVLLYRLLHVSRFDVAGGATLKTCWLEKWRTEAIESGVRAVKRLSKNVQEAITTLGTGFLHHPDNASLREDLDVQAFHNALLRLVYRLLFLFVAEDRKALHPPQAGEQARERYARYFSTARLRAQARRRRGTSHSDLYQTLRIVLDAFGHENGRPELGLPGLGGLFNDTDADAPLRGLSVSNEYLLTAIRHLSQVRDLGSRRWRPVDYEHLDAEELGSIYESLLELVPKHSAVDRTFELVELAGNARKTTGSYYTPSALIDCLLDSALDPVIDDAVKRGEIRATRSGQPDPREAIAAELLALTVCDPACGSGHFLVAAARRIAKRLAAVREQNPEPTVDAVRHALHGVVARCIYGVDLNPMAVELAKVSLWLEALEPGKPLSFLDAHIKCGNSLVGATPKLLRDGILDEAFKPIEGDDKKIAKSLERRNADERKDQIALFDPDDDAKVANTVFAQSLRRITAAPSHTLEHVRKQESAYREWESSAEYQRALHVADAWCAAFMWKKTKDAPRGVTHGIFRALENPDASVGLQETHDEITRLQEQYRFFHWHLEFPEIFEVPERGTDGNSTAGWAGGFDCVLGNPPWERIKLKEQEFFAQRDAEIAMAPNAAARRRLIAELPKTRPNLATEFNAEKRRGDGEAHFIRNSGRYKLTGIGTVNTYAAFSEGNRTLIRRTGRMGVIVPTGIAMDATTQFFFKDLVQSESIAALYDFENASPLFPSVHRSFKFSILSLAGRALSEHAARFAFFLHDPAEIAEKTFPLTPEEIILINPNSGTCPVFRSRRDAEVTLDIYRRVEVLVRTGSPRKNPWSLHLGRMFHMSDDSESFFTHDQLEPAGGKRSGSSFSASKTNMVPLYEAKMLHQYDHRWATYEENGAARDVDIEEKRNSTFEVAPRYWIDDSEVHSKLSSIHWNQDWLIAVRKICRSTDERTLISCVFPRAGLGDSANLMLPFESRVATLLIAAVSSFVLDYVLRQKNGGTNLTFFLLEQLPVHSPRQLFTHEKFINARLLELTYTAYDMAPFARDLGDASAPFSWDEERRAVIRAELDALFFHLYGISREDVDYIMDTFPIVKRKDEAKYGTYRTKELILAEYDRMAAVGVSLTDPLIDGENYISTLTPPPGHGPRHPAAPATATVGTEGES